MSAPGNQGARGKDGERVTACQQRRQAMFRVPMGPGDERRACPRYAPPDLLERLGATHVTRLEVGQEPVVRFTTERAPHQCKLVAKRSKESGEACD
jgi:hypothetical protein